MISQRTDIIYSHVLRDKIQEDLQFHFFPSCPLQLLHSMAFFNVRRRASRGEKEHLLTQNITQLFIFDDKRYFIIISILICVRRY